MLFHQDGAWLYPINIVLDILNIHFHVQVIFNHYHGQFRVGWSCPPCSLDMINPCDYILWDFLKHDAYTAIILKLTQIQKVKYAQSLVNIAANIFEADSVIFSLACTPCC
jgi:hypothetical protein